MTVLTRDIGDLKAMHDAALKMKLDGTPSPDLRKFQSRDADKIIAKNLGASLRREGIERPAAPLTQQASYWQRYGNTFNYFKLFSIKNRRSPDTLKKLIFSNNPPLPTGESVSSRKRRVQHFNWYKKFKMNLHQLDNEHDAHRLLMGPRNISRRWWLAPSLNDEDLPPIVSKAPPPIQLVRELEYVLTVFQIIFESASLLSRAGAFTIPKRSDFRAGPVELVRAFLKARGSGELQKLLAISLHCYENDVAIRLPSWVRRAQEEIEDTEDQNRLITFHGDRNIADFANYDRKELLEQLADLHVDYCNQQAKPHAIIVEKFFPKPHLGPPHGRLTPNFSSNRWGPHGYRFEAAIAFEKSQKYG
jgi:hypothetical protein